MSSVRDNVSRNRCALEIGGQTAFAACRDMGNVRIFAHTEVPEALGDRESAAGS